MKKNKVLLKDIKKNDKEISKRIDEKYNNFKRDKNKIEFENGEKVYRKINKNELDKFLDKN